MTSPLFCFSQFLSFIIHIVLIILFSFSGVNVFKSIPKPLEVSYLQLSSSEKVETKFAFKKEVQAFEDREDPFKNVEILDKKGDDAAFIQQNLKDVSKMAQKFKLGKKPTPTIKTLDVDKKISVELVSSEKLDDNVKYISYNNEIRNRIKQRMLLYIKNKNINAGHVLISFLVTADGQIKESKIREDKTEASDEVRKIALRALKDSAPFPSTKDMINLPEIPYKIMIEVVPPDN